ncbi:bacteriohemerythrin [Methylobacter sp. BBA5.1]|uniref:bacteriohemerythrin n=1 Tax=Methylobacter sp. BBA5.1 TaxID=1495064 RepID=UPI00056C57B5|nr:bacteriohemerythrin [Methylobacter sp. BBA5.1]
MAIFIWDTQLSTGIDEIDTHHQQIFKLINNLNEIIAANGEHQIRLRALDKLVAYIYYHFDAEEHFMRQNGYPEPFFLEHQIKHQAFIKKIAKEQLRCTSTPERITLELLDFLTNWFIDHIINVDKQIVLTVAGAEQSVEETGAGYVIKDACRNLSRANDSRFWEFADNVPAFIWLKDELNQSMYCNKHWQQTTGFTARECPAAVWLNFVHQNDRDRLSAEYARAFAERSTLQIEYRLMSHEGNYLSILETAAPGILENDGFAGFTGWGTNISRHKQIEAAQALSVEQLEEMVKNQTEELQQTREMLNREKEARRALKEKLTEAQGHLIQSGKMAAIGKLASGIAQEINNPLDSVYSNLNTLKQFLHNINRLTDMTKRLAGQLPHDNSEVAAFNALKKQLAPASLIDDLNGRLKAAIADADRAQKLVQDLYSLARNDKRDKEPFDIEQNLDSILTILNNEFKYKAEIIKDYAGIKPVRCIGSDLIQVFMNLLINAAQAIEGFGKITIRTGYKNSDWLWFEIEDTGTGIPDSIKNRIFEPFFTTKPADKVLGLGLSLSHKIIQDHQGEFVIDSTVDQGTRFRIYLPAG